MGQERRDGPQAHFVTVQGPPIDTDRLQRQIGAPRDLTRQTILQVELIRQPAQLISAGVPVAEGKPRPIVTALLDVDEGEIFRQSVWIEEALLGMRIETERVLTPLPQPQRRQLDGGL